MIGAALDAGHLGQAANYGNHILVEDQLRVRVWSLAITREKIVAICHDREAHKFIKIGPFDIDEVVYDGRTLLDVLMRASPYDLGLLIRSLVH